MDAKPAVVGTLGPPVIRLTPSGPRPIVVRTVSSTAPVAIGTLPPQKQKVYKVIAFVPDTKSGGLPRPPIAPVLKTQQHQSLPQTHLTNFKPEASGSPSTLISLLTPKPQQVLPSHTLTTLPLAAAASATPAGIAPPQDNFTPPANSQPVVKKYSPPHPPPPTEMVHWPTEQRRPPSPSPPCPSHQPPTHKEQQQQHSSSRASLLASHLHQIAELAALASSTDLQQMSIHLQQLEDEWKEELFNNSSTAGDDDETGRFPSSCASASPSRSTPLSDATEACEGEYEEEEEEEEEENYCEDERGANLTETYESTHTDPTASSSGHHRSIAPILLQLGQADLVGKSSASSPGSLQTAPKRKMDALQN